MSIRFTKMHGLGNDFVVINAIHQASALQAINLTAERIRQWADRHTGIGFDQLLLVEKSATPLADFQYRIFNADGREVEQCGNGARCFMSFIHQHHLSPKTTLQVETLGGIITLHLQDQGMVTVNMGTPDFDPRNIPFIADEVSDRYPLAVGENSVTLLIANIGNPHAIQVVSNIHTAPVLEQGSLISEHPRFPERVNVGFMQIVDAHHIQLRVYERGSGETLACGTGACAAAVTGIREGLLHSPVKVSMRGGDLDIVWEGNQQPILMTGPAVTVFEGEIPMSNHPFQEPCMNLNDDQICQYLIDHPDFFVSHVELLNKIRLPSPHGEHAISLIEKQQQIQRSKISALENKMTELLQIAERNYTTGDRIHQLMLGLLTSNTLTQLIDIVDYNLRACFDISHVAIRLWGKPHVPTDMHLKALHPIDANICEWVKSLNTPYCGSNPKIRLDTLFEETEEKPLSFVLLALRDEQTFGLLCIGSLSEDRFNSDMGTFYLQQIEELVSKALLQHLSL